MQRIRLIISGDVQGVGFRAWALRQARDKRLTGWVRNREDGSVEIVAEGSQKLLNEFIALCRNGPEGAWVKNIQVKWDKASGEFADFSVVY